jgi:DHA1 family bicyclomycin/chloramphenicol resistance-like MFS transporter
MPSPVPANALRFPLILGSLIAFAPLSVDMYLAALPTIEREFGITTGPAQLTLSAYLLGMALGQLVYGPLSDRFGRKPPLYAGLVIYVLASIGCAAASSIEALIALRFVQAVGGSAGMVIARATVRDLFEPREAARMFSLLMLVMGVAPILAPLAGGYVMLAAGWRAIFWVLALAGAVALAAVAALLPETRRAGTVAATGLASAMRGFAAVLTERRFLAATLTGGFAGAGMFGYISASPFVFIGVFGVAPESFGWIFGANAAGLIACSQLNRRLLLRHPPARLLRAALVVNLAAGIAVLAAALAGAGMFVLLAPIFVCISTLGFIFPNAGALALAPFPDRAGVASALQGTIAHTIGAAVGAVVGALHDASAVPMAAAFALCGIAAHLALRIAPR